MPIRGVSIEEANKQFAQTSSEAARVQSNSDTFQAILCEITTRRNMLGLTQKDLADRLRIPVRDVLDFETGDITALSIRQMLALLYELGAKVVVEPINKEANDAKS